MSAATQARYGLIGLGNVGSDLVRAACRAGLEVHVFDIAHESVERATAAGAIAHDEVGSVARDADVLVLSLPNSEVVDDVLIGSGALSAMRPGSLLIDMSTNLPERAIALAEQSRRYGVHVLDAPVSYGPDGLVAFVGGDGADVEAARPWLDAVVLEYTHVGPHGHGQYVKLVQNVLTGVGMGVIAEVIGFTSRAGVDVGVLPAALRRTGAHSPLLERTLPSMVQRQYGTTGTMALHSKDMGYALRAAEHVGAHMPFTAALRRVFEETLAAGDRRWTQAALIERFAPAQITQPAEEVR